MVENTIAMSFSHSPAPGHDWTAWVVFRPLTSGFSVLARYSDSETRRATRIARSRVVLSWRSACKALLRVQECWLLDVGCGFLSSVDVCGLRGWRADLLASCWFGDEYRYRREIRFLCGQSEKALESLHTCFADGIAGKECLEVLSEALDLFGERCALESVCGPAGLSSAALLAAVASETERFEVEARADAALRSAALAPFTNALVALIETATERWPKTSGYAAGLGFMFRRSALTSRATDFVLREGRLPDPSEFSEIEKDVRAIRTFRL